MRKVGVLEAKTHFSRLLAEVERGEAVVITRHGKAVARVLPAEAREEERRSWERFIEAAEKYGVELPPGEHVVDYIRAGRRY